MVVWKACRSCALRNSMVALFSFAEIAASIVAAVSDTSRFLFVVSLLVTCRRQQGWWRLLHGNSALRAVCAVLNRICLLGLCVGQGMWFVGVPESLSCVAGSSGPVSQRAETVSENEVLALGRAETDSENGVVALGRAGTDYEREVLAVECAETDSVYEPEFACAELSATGSSKDTEKTPQNSACVLLFDPQAPVHEGAVVDDTNPAVEVSIDVDLMKAREDGPDLVHGSTEIRRQDGWTSSAKSQRCSLTSASCRARSQ